MALDFEKELKEIIDKMRNAQSENNVVGSEVKGVNIEDIKGKKGNEAGKGK